MPLGEICFPSNVKICIDHQASLLYSWDEVQSNGTSLVMLDIKHFIFTSSSNQQSFKYSSYGMMGIC